MRLTDSDSGRAANWQLVESCGYMADIRAWRDLAGDPEHTVLDLGCGIGRVARPLAADGHPVLGVDRDPELVAEFNRMAVERRIAAITGDVLALRPDEIDLGRERFDRVFAPQQLIQILPGGRPGRQLFLAGVRSRLTEGGRAAFAISERMPKVSTAAEILPDVRELDGWVYSSRPTGIEATEDSVTVVRLRQMVAPDGSLEESEDRITLNRVDRTGLAGELGEAGLTVLRIIEIPPTDLHVGSTVIVTGHA